jgi:pyruvate,water dikinase
MKVYVMAEVPSNILLADEFLKIFDGFSIGSNDLTQLTLGLDRDSSMIASIGDERNEAVKKLVAQAIQSCRRRNKYSGICGEAPSNYSSFALFLAKEGIESISVSAPVAIKTISLLAKVQGLKKK